MLCSESGKVPRSPASKYMRSHTAACLEDDLDLPRLCCLGTCKPWLHDFSSEAAICTEVAAESGPRIDG